MLSRIAESFFWLGRYLERAEATSRLLAEHHQLLVEDRSVVEVIACDALMQALAVPGESASSATDLVRLVVGSDTQASTIIGAVAAARDNARAVRDSLSGDTYEALNRAHLEISRGMAMRGSPGVALYNVLERLLVVNGVIDWTMPRDEAYYFMMLGKELERIDMMGRVLAVRHDLFWPTAGPVAALRASGALSAFHRAGAPLTGDEARRFLVLDPTFPRSMLSCAVDAEEAVRALERMGIGGNTPLLREAGRLRASLEYAASTNPEYIDRLASESRTAAAQTADEVTRTFFRQHGTITWSH